MKKIFKNKKVKPRPKVLREKFVRLGSFSCGRGGTPHQKQNLRKRNMFFGARVTIMGLGLHGGGVGVAKFFCKQGIKVLVTDLKTKEQLKESLMKLKGFPIKYVLGRHRKKDFIDTDFIIKNPAVPKSSPFLKIARKHKIPIETDVNIFFKLCKAPIIGITGTKGKSTVATLIYKLLKTKYPNVVLAGNIGVSPLEFLSRINKKTKVVLELSSFELEGLEKSPNIAVITEIYPDHLDRYKSLADYIGAKKIIFKHQGPKDILILNYDNQKTRKLSFLARSQVYFYSKIYIPKSKNLKNFACFLKDRNIFFSGEKKPICNIKDFKLYGEHNISNILVAISVAKILKVSSKNIKKIISKFRGISSRQEFIRKVKEVKYFNDTTATMPNATIEAIKVFSQRFQNSKIILIAGGQDKNLDYKDLAKIVQKKVNCLIFLPGSASDKLKRALKSLVISKRTKILSADSMENAVRKSSNIAKKGDIVLLSPGAASFNLFKNEFDRGEQFIKLVKQIK